MKPHQGLIKKSEHQIVLFKFVPKSDTYIIEKCLMTLNYMPGRHQLEVGVIGAGLLPYVHLENNGVLYFAPTCKYKESFQYYELTNQTRSVIGYEWKIPYESKDLFSVDSVKFVLQPYEKKVNQLFFCANLLRFKFYFIIFKKEMFMEIYTGQN